MNKSDTLKAQIFYHHKNSVSTTVMIEILIYGDFLEIKRIYLADFPFYTREITFVTLFASLKTKGLLKMAFSKWKVFALLLPSERGLL